MEDNNTYTYQRKDKQAENESPYNRRLIILFIAAIALLIVLGVVLGKYMGMRSANKQDESISESETESISETEPSEVQPTELYGEGEYLVSTGGSSLKFRKGYSLDSDVILEIKDGTRLNITEVYHDENAGENGSSVEYWGKTTYYGYDGWVAMNYLTNVYSESIVTPEELPSEESTTLPSESAPESTTRSSSEQQSTEAAASESASAETSSSEAPSSPDESTTAASGAKYSTGDYKVSTGGSTLSFRKSASSTSELIMALSDGTQVTVTRVVDAGGSDETRRYWGEISYLGYTGYVSMYYLTKVS